MRFAELKEAQICDLPKNDICFRTPCLPPKSKTRWYPSKKVARRSATTWIIKTNSLLSVRVTTNGVVSSKLDEDRAPLNIFLTSFSNKLH